jgi:hypothetical protein
MDPVLVTAFCFYILGILSGAVGVVALTLYLGKRSLDRKVKENAATGKQIESVSSRMKKVKDITTEQLDLQGQSLGPQKNALHGKYKNGLIGRIKELETQKNDILKSIIEDGFDPEITTIDQAGVVSNIKLSDFLASLGIFVPSKNSETSTKQVGKFTVHKGGKDDGGNTTH